MKLKIDEKDLIRLNKALKRVERVIKKEESLMPKKMAHTFKRLIRFNIMSKKYSFAPYSPGYKKWKILMGLYSKGFWRLEDKLVSSIRVEPIDKRTFFSGVPKGVPGSYDENVGAYACRMEYGIGQPSRPMFGNTFDEYKEQNVFDQIKEVKNSINRGWV